MNKKAHLPIRFKAIIQQLAIEVQHAFVHFFTPARYGELELCCTSRLRQVQQHSCKIHAIPLYTIQLSPNVNPETFEPGAVLFRKGFIQSPLSYMPVASPSSRRM